MANIPTVVGIFTVNTNSNKWPLIPLDGQLWPAGNLAPVRRYVLQPESLEADFTVPEGFRMDTFGDFDIDATLDVAGTYEAK